MQEELEVFFTEKDLPLIPHPNEFANCVVGLEFGRKLFNIMNGFPIESTKWTFKKKDKK